MKIFERITKRPALLNYYLRRSFYWPDTLPEVLDYWQQHNELPFLYGGDNWPYDAMCERQRRKGVYASQYLTPDRTARQMAALAVRYFDNDSRVVDACCGTGQLTRALILEGVHPSAILGFDTDAELVDLYAFLFRSCRTADAVSRDRFPLRERHRKSAVRDCGVCLPSCNGSPARNTRAIGPCCFCRTALSTSRVRNPCRRRCGTLSSATGHPCRSRSHVRIAVRRSS